MSTFLLIDGNGIMHRAYHALPPFKTKKGIATQVVYGFFSMIDKAIADFSPSYLTVCFDTPKPTFRNKIFKDYQIQRPKIADDFRVQIPLVKKGLDFAGIVYLEKEGFEADDIIGTLVKKYHSSKKNLKILILSGDKDLLQLVGDNVFVVSPQIGFSKTKIYDKKEILKKFLIAPRQIADFKALTGDSSDNYLGAKGIGPKTASRLINQFQTTENLFKNLNKIKKPTIKEILKENKENILLAKKLAKIVTSVKIDFNFNQAKFTGFKPELKDFLLQLEMNSLVKRIFTQSPNEKKKPKKINHQQIELF